MFKTSGLVIKENNVGDYDKSLVILTGDRGRIQAWSRGSRRLKSPLMSASQLFTYADFTVFEGKSSLSLRNAETVDSFFDLRGDIGRLALAGYFAELVYSVTDEESGDPRILRLMLNALHALARTEKREDLIKPAFELKLMQLSGFLPEMDYCVNCGEPIDPAAAVYDRDSGGFVCALCRPSGETTPAGAYLAMRYIGSAPLEKLYSYDLGEENAGIVAALTEAYALQTVGRDLRTLDFYRRVSSL